jgi:hypothetical protein
MRVFIFFIFLSLMSNFGFGQLVHRQRLIILSDIEADPDGDSFNFLWFNYPEAGTWEKPIPSEGAENSHDVYIISPKVDKEVAAHFILKVTDKGLPQLSAYKRVIVTIKPE